MQSVALLSFNKNSMVKKALVETQFNCWPKL